MSENIDNRFMGEMLRGVQTSIADLDKRMQAGFADLDRRMIELERFQSAVLHSHQGIIAHLAGIHESVNDMKAHYRRLDQRMDAVEAH